MKKDVTLFVSLSTVPSDHGSARLGFYEENRESPLALNPVSFEHIGHFGMGVDIYRHVSVSVCSAAARTVPPGQAILGRLARDAYGRAPGRVFVLESGGRLAVAAWAVDTVRGAAADADHAYMSQ